MTNAGSAWCDLYPTSRSLDDLVEPFQGNVRGFIDDLKARGCTVVVAATRRPRERAWLMHWAWAIAKGEVAPESVRANPAVPIVWSLEGAKEMVATYKLAYRPSLTSRHIEGMAIDMRVEGWPLTASELYHLGAAHGVIKLLSDPPHWSSDGR